MQELASEPRYPVALAGGVAAVDRVADDRVVQRGEVHADLVRAAGEQGGLDQRVAVEVVADAV